MSSVFVYCLCSVQIIIKIMNSIGYDGGNDECLQNFSEETSWETSTWDDREGEY
jgi:hypothetical protein